MPRWLWIPLVILGVFLMFLAGPGTEWINSLVHTDSFRHEIEARAGAAAGGKVEIQDIEFSLWRGVQLRGLVTKLSTPQGTVAAKIESVNCSYSLFALLRRRLQLNRVTLEKPNIELTQEAPEQVATPTAEGKEKTHATSDQAAQAAPIQVVLESGKINDGHLTIRDASGALKADLQGVKVVADTGGLYDNGDASGEMSIAKIALPKNLAITDFSTPFKGRVGVMEADPFEATAFGGKITGHYHLDPGGAPSTLDLNASDIDMGQVSKTANPGSSTMLSGSLTLQSTFRGPETGTLTGEGDAEITHGRLQGVAMLNKMGSLLHIGGMVDPELKSVTTHFEVAGGTTRFSHLRIEAAAFDLTGDGTISPDGRLDAEMVLTLHGGAMGGVPGLAAALFSRVPGGGGSIPFHLSGNVSDPQTNLSPQLLNPAPVAHKAEHLLEKVSHLF
jgi:uncharacterized protein involved in outer membrane biogenesis